MSMQLPKVVIADLNEDYALRLEDKFLRMMRGNIDLDVITSSEYFYKFFSVPVHVDVALLAEDLVDEDLSNQDILKLYVLSEEQPSKSLDDDHTVHVYKYTSLSHVFNQTMGAYAHLAYSSFSEQDPKSVVFFSPVGGSGKTTLAAGVATCLQESGFKVLYIDAEYQQEMGNLFSSVRKAPNAMAMLLAREANNPYQKIKEHIIHDVVDVVPPLAMNVMMYGIDFSSYTALITGATRSGDYDYVVVDTDSVFNAEKLALLQASDSVVVVTRQDEIAVRKTLGFLNGLDTNGRSKCHVVCNDYRLGVPDEFSRLQNADQLVEAKINRNDEIARMSADALASREDIVTVTYIVR